MNYDYDPAGQRNAVWGSYARTGLPTAQSSFTYDAANELTKIGNSRTTNDANGSLTNDTVTSYTWNNRGQLASSSKTGLSASYAYDAHGRRRSKTISGQTTGFLYVNLKDTIPILENLVTSSGRKIPPAVQQNLAPLQSMLFYSTVDGPKATIAGFVGIQ